MASKDDLSIPSVSGNSFDPFEPEPSAKPKRGTGLLSFGNASKKPASKGNNDETDSLSYVETFGSPISCHAIRLQPGAELRKALLEVVAKRNLKAPFIMACVGSAKNAKLRLANATAEEQHFVCLFRYFCFYICMNIYTTNRRNITLWLET